MTSKIVSQDEWLAARKVLLAKEKAFTKERDALAAARRDLPMVKMTKPYVFDSKTGKKTLGDLFEGQRQLLVYHFMFDPSWDEGCKSCSFIADHVDGMLPHLAARSTAFVAISRAPLAKLGAYQKRMGWSFPWVSSGETDFNFDFNVSFTAEDREAGRATYNYRPAKVTNPELPGLSTFLRDGDDVLHAYSMYSRGVDILMGTYNYLDLTPLGRDEAGLPYGMAWLKHHDKYGA